MAVRKGSASDGGFECNKRLLVLAGGGGLGEVCARGGLGEPCSGGWDVLCLAVPRLGSESLLERWAGLGLTGGLGLAGSFDVFFTLLDPTLSSLSITTSGLIAGSTSGFTGFTTGLTSGLAGFTTGSTSGLAGFTTGSTSGLAGFTTGLTSGLVGLIASSTACAVSLAALASVVVLITAASRGLAAPACAADEEAEVLVGGGGRGILGGGGISLVAGLLTLCTLAPCLERRIGAVLGEGEFLVATSSASASLMAGVLLPVMGGVFGVARVAGGGGGRRRGLCGSSVLTVVRRLRGLAMGCCSSAPSLLLVVLCSLTEDGGVVSVVVSGEGEMGGVEGSLASEGGDSYRSKCTL